MPTGVSRQDRGLRCQRNKRGRGNSLRHTGSQQILLFANSASSGQLAPPQSTQLERLAGTAARAPTLARVLFCPLISAPAFPHVGERAGKGKIHCSLFRPRANDNSLEQSCSAGFCQALARQVFPVLFLPRFQLLSCPFLAFPFTMSFSCLGKGKG